MSPKSLDSPVVIVRGVLTHLRRSRRPVRNGRRVVFSVALGGGASSAASCAITTFTTTAHSRHWRPALNRRRTGRKSPTTRATRLPCIAPFGRRMPISRCARENYHLNGKFLSGRFCRQRFETKWHCRMAPSPPGQTLSSSAHLDELNPAIGSRSFELGADDG